MDFKSTDALFSKIREDFYSFDAAGLLDEGKFHKDVQYVLASLGIMWYRHDQEMITIKDYRGLLPDNFHLVDSVYKCESSGADPIFIPEGIVFRQLNFDHYPETQIPDWHVAPTCPDYWDSPPKDIFNAWSYLLVQRNNMMYSYKKPCLMSPGNVNTRKHCSKNCEGLYANAEDRYTIQNGQIYTNFQEGEIMLTYTAFPVDEQGLPMIPNDPVIEKSIEFYIKYNIVLTLITNGDADIARLLPVYEAEKDKYMGQAITLTKTPSFETMVHNVKLVRKRLNVFQLPYSR